PYFLKEGGGGLTTASPRAADPEMLLDDGEVPQVRLPDHVEQIAEHQHCAERRLDGDVPEHPCPLRPWHAELLRLVDDPERDQREQRVACGRRESDDAVEAEPEPGAWDAAGGVDEPRQ